MNNYLLISIGFAITVFSTNSLAEWEPAYTDVDRTGYFDKSTIRKSGNMVKMLTMENFFLPKLEPVGKPFLSTKQMDEYDCANETSRGIAIVFYSGHMGSGDILLSHSFNNDKFEPIIRNSSWAELWKIACSK